MLAFLVPKFVFKIIKYIPLQQGLRLFYEPIE